jgi:Ca2+-binding EF-hand superfamily protein
MTVVYFKGREITIFTFQRFVINKAFMSLLPEEYTLEEAEDVRKQVYNFYDTAMEGEVSEQELLEVSTLIQSILADQKVEDKEVQSLLTLIDTGGGR